MRQRQKFYHIALGLLLCLSLNPGCSFGDEEGSDEGKANAGQDGGGSLDEDGQGQDAPVIPSCPPGLSGCVAGERVVCNEAGNAFELDPCPSEKFCVAGSCSECASDDHCDAGAGETCLAGICAVPKLEVLTVALPTALLGKNYAAQLEATGGVPPYSWKLAQGTLPDGLLLEASGKLGGIAKAAGKASILVQATDTKENVADRILVIEVVEGGLLITTPSPLKKGIEGAKYQVKLEATGGTKPYFWGQVGGALPKGVALGSDGHIAGVPAEDGTFKFDIKAFDNGVPTESTSKAFELNIGLAPLEIIGQQEVNLFITKLIVLPLIIVVNGIPVPYNGLSKAQSKSAIFIIPTAPVGRSIAGRRSGSIVDLGQVCVFVATIVTAAATAAV